MTFDELASIPRLLGQDANRWRTPQVFASLLFMFAFNMVDDFEAIRFRGVKFPLLAHRIGIHDGQSIVRAISCLNRQERDGRERPVRPDIYFIVTCSLPSAWVWVLGEAFGACSA